MVLTALRSAFLHPPSHGLILYHRPRLSGAAATARKNASSTAADSLHPPESSSLPPVPPNCHRLVLMRHGESEFNNAHVFTGWCDVPLTPRGVVEAVEAGQVFLSHNLHFRKCYVSLLTRSIVTAHRSLEAAGVSYTPLNYDWRWNERHYGALQGLSKERTAIRLGRQKVMKWRRSYEARPPRMTSLHPHYPSIQNDPRYRNVIENIPTRESLQDCQHRVMKAWEDLTTEITTSVTDNDFPHSLLVAHANTLRALVMNLDEIDVNDIEDLNIPTAIPFYYDLDRETGKVVRSADHQEGTGAFSGCYITDERKKHSFLERRRASNDPFLWALHDHQVATSLLHEQEEGFPDIEEEARKNTELFAPGQTTSTTTTTTLV